MRGIKMRCFLAIELPEEIKKELVKVQEEFGSLINAKFVEKENLHLTLKFFPDVDAKDFNDVKKSLKEIKFEKFSSNLGKIGFFPDEKFIRVLWVSLESEKFKELYQEINSKLINFNEEDRFESHVTLARIKEIKDKSTFLEKIKEIEIKPIEFTVNSFVLKKSTLTEKGPIYEDIEKFELI
jgi:2'-5' RNA ligase